MKEPQPGPPENSRHDPHDTETPETHAGGMSACRDMDAETAAYADGDTSLCDGDRVRAHLDACPPCREQFSRQRVARDAVRARRDGLRAAAPASLKARCIASAMQHGQPAVSAGPVRQGRRPVRQLLVRWAPLSVAATLLLAVATVFGFGLNNKVQALAFQTTIDHVKCSRLSSASGADPAAAARQWQARFGWDIRVPASTPSGLQLREVRRCAVTDGRVAHLIYSWMGEPLSVFVLPSAVLGDPGREPEVVRRFRHEAIMWSQNGRTYIMVTPHRRDPALEHVVAYVRANAY